MHKRFLFDVEDEDVLKLFLEELREFTEYKVDMEGREVLLPKDVKRMSSRRGNLPKDVQWKMMDLLVCMTSLDHWKFLPRQTFPNIYYTTRGELFVLPGAFKYTEYPKMENAIVMVSALAAELKDCTDVYEILVAAEELKLAHITIPVPSERFLSYRCTSEAGAENPLETIGNSSSSSRAAAADGTRENPFEIDSEPEEFLECNFLAAAEEEDDCFIELTDTEDDDDKREEPEPLSKKSKSLEIDLEDEKALRIFLGLEEQPFQWCDYYEEGPFEFPEVDPLFESCIY